MPKAAVNAVATRVLGKQLVWIKCRGAGEGNGGQKASSSRLLHAGLKKPKSRK
jgi:hypothetical protein